MFLFYKNLSVTNISLRELIALLNRHASRLDGSRLSGLKFFSDDEYTNFLVNLFSSFCDVREDESSEALEKEVDRIVAAIFKSYKDIFYDTVIFDAYFTCVVVHVPRSLSINVLAVVSESGYVHSAGTALYIRNVNKVAQRDLRKTIRDFTDPISPKPVYLTPYADEYFAPYEEQNSATSIRNGLDGIRIQLRKHYIEGEALRTFLNRLHDPHSVYVAPGLKNYREEREESHANPDWTIWLISDTRVTTTVDDGLTGRGRDHYLIVFAQYFNNANQFILFKERKPAWVAPITLPHTLSISMVNLALANLPTTSQRSPVILDPFCGTGTTLIDAALRIPRATVIGLDRQAMTPQLVRDNARFFSLTVRQIDSIWALFTTIRTEIHNYVEKTGTSSMRPIADVLNDLGAFRKSELLGKESTSTERFLNVLKLILVEIVKARPAEGQIERSLAEIVDKGFSSDLVRFLQDRQLEFEDKILFYVAWRAIVNGRYTFRHSVENIYRVLLAEFDDFVRELSDYKRQLGRRAIEQIGAFSIAYGRYSRESITSPRRMRELEKSVVEANPQVLVRQLNSRATSKGIYVSTVDDSVDLLGRLKQSIDVIITDPPYGFNTNETDATGLRQLYGRLFSNSLAALRPGGQLIIALPAFSRIGRQIPFYQTKGAITRQVIAAAEGLKRHVIAQAQALPGRRYLFNPPFFWTSQTALARDVLWFTIS